MAGARTITDHDEIRQWAEARDARPACVKGTGGPGDAGMIRLDFPGYSGADSLQPISWDEWFTQFDANRLALLVQDTTASGEESHFNKLVSRQRAQADEADEDDEDEEDEDEDEDEDESEEDEDDEDLDDEEDDLDEDDDEETDDDTTTR
jgi:hypothetical protein